MTHHANSLPEYLIIAERRQGKLIPHGCVTRELAHSEYRIPHTSTLIVPVISHSYDVVIHLRNKQGIGANKWDFAGGHVAFEPAALQGTEALLACIEKTAIREAREEILAVNDAKPVIIQETDLFRCTEAGELAADEPRNLEFSTGFLVLLPKSADILLADEDMTGIVRPLVTKRLSVDDVIGMFNNRPDDFADGARRILATGQLRNWIQQSEITKESNLGSS